MNFYAQLAVCSLCFTLAILVSHWFSCVWCNLQNICGIFLLYYDYLHPFKIKFYHFSFTFLREQSSVNKSSDDSDLETPVKTPTTGRGRKRAAGIFKATPVHCV